MSKYLLFFNTILEEAIVLFLDSVFQFPVSVQHPTPRLWKKQGRIHGNPVADGWAGAVMRNRSEFKNVTDGRTDRPTDLPTDTARCRVNFGFG